MHSLAKGDVAMWHGHSMVGFPSFATDVTERVSGTMWTLGSRPRMLDCWASIEMFDLPLKSIGWHAATTWPRAKGKHKHEVARVSKNET